MKKEPILEVRNLTVSFGARKALDGVSFSLYPGEILALVGESGSGKTLTALSVLDLLPRAARRDEGSVVFEGKNIFDMKTETKRALRGAKISIVFQEPFSSLNPVMTVGDEIAEAITAHDTLSRGNLRSRVAYLVELVKLPLDVTSRYPHELSGGMCQRVNLAAALSCEPSVLILDEPTTALDVSIQKHMLELIKRVQSEKGLSMIFITHDLSIMNLVADRVCVMRGGRIVEEGTKEDIVKRPSHAYTKGLVECIPRLGDKRKRLAQIA